MTSCCTPSRSLEGTNKFFSRQAKRLVKRFRKKGLAGEQRLLEEGILKSAPGGSSILEIGCGVGGLHHTLLKRGLGSAVGIDISEGMIAGARELSGELGLENRTSYLLGDFVEIHGRIEKADITILDKVVCCYENVDELLVQSLSKTKRVYALSFPKPNLLIKLVFHVPIAIGTLLGWSFHPYWHDWHRMRQRIEENGFKPSFHGSTFVWDVHVFERE